jgi:hypothetical protein
MFSAARLDALLDRPLSALAAMVFTLCLLTAFVVWYRVLIVRPHMLLKENAAPVAPVLAQPDTKTIVIATGLAFVALAELFAIITLGKMKAIRWSTFAVDLVLLQVYLTVIVATLATVRAATLAVCGNHALFIFAGLSGSVGAVVYYLGG